MKRTQTPVFEVNFGHQNDEDSDMTVLATYVIYGLVQSETTRHERISKITDRLALPEGADDFRIGQRLETNAAADYRTVLRVVTDLGIVADLVEPATAAKEEPATTSALPAGLGEPIPLFPVQSLFQQA